MRLCHVCAAVACGNGVVSNAGEDGAGVDGSGSLIPLASCACNAGYVGGGDWEGNNAVDAYPPCVAVTCTNGVISGLGGATPSCSCDAGYAGGGDWEGNDADGVAVVDAYPPCVEVSCSNGVISGLEGGATPSCSCNAGYAGGGDWDPSSSVYPPCQGAHAPGAHVVRAMAARASLPCALRCPRGVGGCVLPPPSSFRCCGHAKRSVRVCARSLVTLIAGVFLPVCVSQRAVGVSIPSLAPMTTRTWVACRPASNALMESTECLVTLCLMTRRIRTVSVILARLRRTSKRMPVTA